MTAEQIAASVPREALVQVADTLAAMLASFSGEASVSAEALGLVLAELQIRLYREGLRV